MMSADKSGSYWFDAEEWYTYDAETEKYSVKPDAPEWVKKSFDIWKSRNPKHAA
jgi:hypothetical protein